MSTIPLKWVIAYTFQQFRPLDEVNSKVHPPPPPPNLITVPVEASLRSDVITVDNLSVVPIQVYTLFRQFKVIEIQPESPQSISELTYLPPITT